MGLIKRLIIVMIFFLAVCSVIYVMHKVNTMLNTEKEGASPGKSHEDRQQSDSSSNALEKQSSAGYTSTSSSDWLFYNSAKQKKDSNKCSYIIDNVTRSICYKQVALLLGAENLCQKIDSKNKKNECLQIIGLNKARNDDKIASCANLSKPMHQMNCIREIIGRNQEVNCVNLKNKEIRDYCKAEKYYQLALKFQDLDYCKRINSGVVRANCFSQVEGVDLFSDEDNDGLNYKKEIYYGTDPSDSDTDGDGYSDKLEIEKRFNAKGEGEDPSVEMESKLLCEDILDEYLQRICFIESAEGWLDLDNCRLISDSELQAYCKKNRL